MLAIELFEINHHRAEEMLKAHQGASPKGRPVEKTFMPDLLRAVVVFAAAALDAYLAMKVVQTVNAICFKKKRFPEKAVGYFVRGDGEANDVKNGAKIARDLLAIATSDNPRKLLVRRLEVALKRTTFQNPEQVSHALAIMEVECPWPKLDKSLVSTRGKKRRGKPLSSEVFLREFIERRNDIVHEGDVYTSFKHHGQLKPITRTWVRESLQKLKRMVIEIERISQVV